MTLVLKLKGKLMIEVQGEGGLVPEQGRASMKPAKTKPKSDNTCPECHKSFPSEKSLYGHMRSHPDRSYRGINPPKSATQNSSSTTVSNSGITAERPAAAPKSAAMRPRKNPFPAPRAPADGMAVGSRLLLAQNDPVKVDVGGLRSSKMKRFIEDVEDEEDYYSGDGYEYEDVYQRNLKRLSHLTEEEEEQKNKEELKNKTCNHTTSEKSEDKSTTKRKLCAIEEEFVTGGRFQCGTCGKSFSSHQALGGHKTSHRKGKTPSSPAGKEKELEASQAKIHVCRSCGKGFSSGQALGGHQRLHREGDAAITAAPASTLVQSSSVGSKEEEKEGEEGAVQPVIGFDLNEFPALEEGDISLSLGLMISA